MSTVRVFFNPKSGQNNDKLLSEFVEQLHQRGLKADVNHVSPEQLEHTIADKLKQLEPNTGMIIAICGGDGTISSAANVLIHTDAVLVPVPFGTLNHFARRHGIVTVSDAAEAIARHEVATVPVGSINNQVFVNNTSFGLYPLAVRNRDRLHCYLPKRLAMVIAVFEALARRPQLNLRINIGDDSVEELTSMLWMGVGKDSFQLPQFDNPDENSDVLKVIVAQAKSRSGLVALGVKLVYKMLLKDKIREDCSLRIFYSEHITMLAGKPVDAAWDGEVGGFQSPIEINLHKNALKVMALNNPTPQLLQ